MSKTSTSIQEMIHTYLVKDVRGATMIEYALLASLISVVVIGALSPIGQRLFAIFDFIRVSLGG